MKIYCLLLLISVHVLASDVDEYKELILSLDTTTLWKLKDLKFEDERIWYYTDGGVKKVWSAFGACRIEDQRTCKDCSCDYYFKSSHPNNRFKGDFPYNSYSEGYPQSPEKLPSSGCMQIDGLKGDCSYNNAFKLCHISNNPEVVLKEYIKHAFNNKKDPCGLKEFVFTKYKKQILNHPLIKKKSKKK